MIPCGKCIGCRLDYSRSWADRMMFELQHTGKGIFLTLTYNDKHIPYGMLDNDTDMPLSYSLDKTDLQKFFKRLRKKFPDTEIRYFACGEYGRSKGSTYRPHYHAIIFGLSLDDFTMKRFMGTNELGQSYFDIQIIDEAWSIYHKATKEKPAWYDPIGYTFASDVSWKTCAYVARYVVKKVNADTEDFDMWRNVYPEFILSSRRPGIGAKFIEDNAMTFDNQKQLFVEGRRLQLPHFLLEKMALTDPEGYDKLKRERRTFAEDKMLLELSQTDLDFEELNQVKEEKQIFRGKMLGREKIK